MCESKQENLPLLTIDVLCVLEQKCDMLLNSICFKLWSVYSDILSSLASQSMQHKLYSNNVRQRKVQGHMSEANSIDRMSWSCN
jgi:hypothetical protein